jgi:serine phosphatase RsbU (regulator of sigma subunit)/anti-sigma regulatory factor (Ser/Thr protein kinase)
VNHFVAASMERAPATAAAVSLLAVVQVRGEADRAICVEALQREGFRVRFAEHCTDAGVLRDAGVNLVVAEPASWASEMLRRADGPRVPFVRVVEADAASDAGDGEDWLLTRPVQPAVLRGYARAARRLAEMVAQCADASEELARRRSEADADAAMARDVLRRLHQRRRDANLPVDAYVAPAAGFSGDLVLAEATPSGHLHVMLADGVGHGLAAALTVLPLTRVFHTMTRKGFGLASIVAEMSQTLRQFLPAGRFVAATFAAFNPSDAMLEVWNAGNPDALLVDDDGAVVRRFPSRHLALGICDYAEQDVKAETVPVDKGAMQFITCSDGIAEATNLRGEMFGLGRVAEIVGQTAPRGRRFALIEGVRNHLEQQEAPDDLSFAIVDCVPGTQMTVPALPPVPARVVQSVRTWRLSLDLGAEQLKRIETVPVLQHFLAQVDGDNLDSPKLYLVLTELFNNALDHGVLELDSRIKSGPDGMTAYLEERRRRLDALSTGTVRLNVVRMERSAGVWLKVVVADSGVGFDHRRLEENGADPLAPHGRGVRLVRAMCDWLEYRGCGNEVEAHLSL